MKNKRGTVLTIGTFDGLHCGHQKIIQKTVQLAKRAGMKPVVLTFEAPPRLFFSPSGELVLLSSPEEKKCLLRARGVNQIHFLKFGLALSKTLAEKFFVDFVVKKFHAQKMVVGYNFCFGREREGTVDFIKKLGEKYSVPVSVVPPFEEGGAPVSSGRIRKALREGKLKEANLLLGYPYFSFGKVVRGKAVGRSLGFPTANLEVNPLKLLPKGVMAVKVEAGRSLYQGMCNVGKRFEVHLFRYRGNLYGKRLKVSFMGWMRHERSFSNLEDLRKQLMLDQKRASALLSHSKLLN